MSKPAKAVVLFVVCAVILFGNRTGVHLLQSYLANGEWPALTDFGRFQLFWRGGLVLLLAAAAVHWGRAE